LSWSSARRVRRNGEHLSAAKEEKGRSSSGSRRKESRKGLFCNRKKGTRLPESALLKQESELRVSGGSRRFLGLMSRTVGPYAGDVGGRLQGARCALGKGGFCEANVRSR